MRVVVLLLLAGCGRVGFGELAPRDGGIGDGLLGEGDGPDAIVIDAPDGSVPPVDAVSPDAMLPSGLVVWFPMDDASPDEATDVVSGFGGSCGSGQCPKTSTGYHGSAFLFDGIDDCIEIPDMGQFGQSELTLSIWLRQDTIDSCSAIAKPANAVGNTADTWQIETTTSDELSFTSTHGNIANQRITTGAGTLKRGVWQHVAATFDGAMKRLYVDGAEVASGTAADALAYGTDSVWLGCDRNGGSPALRFNGALDDFQVYNRALSLAEIQALAAM